MDSRCLLGLDHETWCTDNGHTGKYISLSMTWIVISIHTCWLTISVRSPLTCHGERCMPLQAMSRSHGPAILAGAEPLWRCIMGDTPKRSVSNKACRPSDSLNSVHAPNKCNVQFKQCYNGEWLK
eukprot:6483697-Amphidinium_carterae.2